MPLIWFRLAFEKGAARACYHGVAEEGVAFRQIAEVIGRRLNVPVISKTPEEAAHTSPGSHISRQLMCRLPVKRHSKAWDGVQRSPG